MKCMICNKEINSNDVCTYTTFGVLCSKCSISVGPSIRIIDMKEWTIDQTQVIEKLIEVFGDINGSSKMLNRALAAYLRLYDKINKLTVQKQYEIIYEVTVMIYQAIISFNININNQPELKYNETRKEI